MSFSAIEPVTELYELQSVSQVSQVVVEHACFKEFCFRLRGLSQAIKEIDDTCWQQPLRKLRHYRFDHCAAPLGFGNEWIMPPQKLAELKLDLEICTDYYPKLKTEVGNLMGSLARLVDENDNPMMIEIVNQIQSVGHLAVLLKESRHIPMFAEVVEASGLSESIEILSQQQLRKVESSFGTILCIGSSRWYKEFIFRTPRSKNTRVIRFGWLADSDCRSTPLFKGWNATRRELETRKKIRAASSSAPSITSGVLTMDNQDWLHDEELVPRFDLSVIANKFVSRDPDRQEGRYDAVARLFELEGNRGAFLESADGSRALVIDLDENSTGLVSRMSTSAITPGMFVLLRGDPEEDAEYIIPIADLILGKRATNLREFQRRWKSALRSLTASIGVTKIIGYLRDEGSTIANETNLRNWLSPRNIRTDAEKDFFAIMRVIGMKDVEEKCWRYAMQIDSAHRRAGRRIRTELLRQVREADLTELEKLGEMRFELEGLGGKPLMALRVVRVSDFTSNVAHHHLNKLFDLEDH